MTKPFVKKWKHPKLHCLISAGGILPIDKNGFWAVEETGGKLSDIGGRYEVTDCDIYKTITRELSEETYNTVEITRKNFLDMVSTNCIEEKYLLGYHGKPVYVYYCVNVEYLEKYGATFDIQLYNEARKKTLKSNYDNALYTKKLVYVPFDEIDKLRDNMSSRLQNIVDEMKN